MKAECSFCSLCKTKLQSEEYVRRHVSGKKHQALLAAAEPQALTNSEATAAAAAAESGGVTVVNAPVLPLPPFDPYIVSYSTLLSAASRRASATAASGNGMSDLAVPIPSKSARKNHKRQMRRKLANSMKEGAKAASTEHGLQPGDADLQSGGAAPAAAAGAPTDGRTDSAAL